MPQPPQNIIQDFFYSLQWNGDPFDQTSYLTFNPFKPNRLSNSYQFE